MIPNDGKIKVQQLIWPEVRAASLSTIARNPNHKNNFHLIGFEGKRSKDGLHFIIIYVVFFI
jgi:hypothetical protein